MLLMKQAQVDFVASDQTLCDAYLSKLTNKLREAIGNGAVIGGIAVAIVIDWSRVTIPPVRCARRLSASTSRWRRRISSFILFLSSLY